MKRLLLKNGPSKGPWGTSLGIVNLHELSPVTRICTDKYCKRIGICVYIFYVISILCLVDRGI